MQTKTQYNEVVIGDYYEALLLPAMYWTIENIRAAIDTEEKYYEQNIAGLKERFPQLYSRIVTLNIDEIVQSKKYQIENTESGLKTLSVSSENGKTIYLHSNGNPLTEASVLAREYYEEPDSTYRICGLGLGYLPETLANMDTTSQIIVYESNLEVLAIALYHRNLKNIWKEERIKLIYDENYTLFRKQIAEGTPIIHYPSIEAMENKEDKEILINYFVQLQSAKNQKIYLEENFSRNIKLTDESVDCLKEELENKKMLLIAGGPSLDKCMEWIAKHKEEYVVVAVGTVLRKLCNYGIQPDFAIITDASTTMIRQIENVETEHIPLMYMATSSHILRKAYKGKAYRILQKGWEQSENYAKEHGLSTYQTGGSVTTTALEIGISFNCKEILCMGMDMAYTNGASHATGTNGFVQEQQNDRMLPVEGVNGEVVYTIRNLSIYREWIERRIKDCKGIRLINVSDGAKVRGVVNVEVEKFLKLGNANVK